MSMRPETAGRFLPLLAALASGLVFGLGLAVAGMTDPAKVQAFLDVAGIWDPSLLFVLGGAVLTAALGFALLARRPAPLLAAAFDAPLPPGRAGIDRRLCLGSALFGLGWALAGYCPGPALAAIGQFNPETLWLVPALLAGTALERWQRRA